MILMETLVLQRKKSLVLILVKPKQKENLLVSITTMIPVIFFLNRKKIYEFKDDNGIVKFTTQFFAWSICNGFRAT